MYCHNYPDNSWLVQLEMMWNVCFQVSIFWTKPREPNRISQSSDSTFTLNITQRLMITTWLSLSLTGQQPSTTESTQYVSQTSPSSSPQVPVAQSAGSEPRLGRARRPAYSCRRKFRSCLRKCAATRHPTAARSQVI